MRTVEGRVTLRYGDFGETSWRRRRLRIATTFLVLVGGLLDAGQKMLAVSKAAGNVQRQGLPDDKSSTSGTLVRIQRFLCSPTTLLARVVDIGLRAARR